MTLCETTDLLVFSHLRWDFVFQRPQHLLSRHAKYRRVFYFEEPIYGMTELPRLHLRETAENVLVVVPYLPSTIDPTKMNEALTDLIDELIYEEELLEYSALYYTPAALSFTRHLEPKTTMFDYMEDHTSYLSAYEAITDLEEELFDRADTVFTSGQSHFESKKSLHHNIHLLPSGIDFHHFSQAREKLVEPDDQVNIPHPRVGFYGAIDERFDFELLTKMADLKPELHFVIIGPVLQMDENSLPKRLNIHYLGKKDYYALPLYLAGWDATIIPYKVNNTTKNISPMQTPEFLAAARRVVSTPISDVVNSYGNEGLVQIAKSGEDFIHAIETSMHERNDTAWINQVDTFLKEISWDNIFKRMAEIESESSNASHARIIHPVSLNVSGVM